MTGLEVKPGGFMGGLIVHGIEIRPKSQEEALSKISGKKKIKHRTFIVYISS